MRIEKHTSNLYLTRGCDTAQAQHAVEGYLERLAGQVWKALEAGVPVYLESSETVQGLSVLGTTLTVKIGHTEGA